MPVRIDIGLAPLVKGVQLITTSDQIGPHRST